MIKITKKIIIITLVLSFTLGIYCLKGECDGNPEGESSDITKKNLTKADTMPQTSTPAPNPIQELINKILIFLKPVEVTIKNVKGAAVYLLPLENSSLIKGMRLDVFKEGEMFHNPVTNEDIGRLEKYTGEIEITEVDKTLITGNILTGTIKPLDKARITSSKFKALYFQQGSIDWYVGDACYRELIKSKRFDLFDTKIKDGNIEKLLVEAKGKGAQILIYADDISEIMRPILRLRMYWVFDGKEFTTETATLDYEYLKSISPKSTLLFASKSLPVITFELPDNARLITVGSFTANNKKEILIATDKYLIIFQGDINKSKILEQQLPKGSEPLYIGAIDLNKNGRDEIILTTLNNNIVHSYIYEIEKSEKDYQDESLITKWETNGFLKVEQDKLLYQGSNPQNADGNSIYNVKFDGKYTISNVYLEKITNPVSNDPNDHVNLYNLILFNAADNTSLALISDSTNHLTLTDINQRKIWQSELMSHNAVTAKYMSNSDTKSMTQWYKSDRLMILNKNILAVNRSSGNSMSMLWWNGNAFIQNNFINEINGNFLDYAISDGLIYILTKSSSGKEIKDFLKGKDPFITNLQVFSINY